MNSDTPNHSIILFAEQSGTCARVYLNVCMHAICTHAHVYSYPYCHTTAWNTYCMVLDCKPSQYYSLMTYNTYDSNQNVSVTRETVGPNRAIVHWMRSGVIAYLAALASKILSSCLSYDMWYKVCKLQQAYGLCRVSPCNALLYFTVVYMISGQ